MSNASTGASGVSFGSDRARSSRNTRKARKAGVVAHGPAAPHLEAGRDRLVVLLDDPSGVTLFDHLDQLRGEVPEKGAGALSFWHFDCVEVPCLGRLQCQGDPVTLCEVWRST